ncbi:MAG: NAD(P)H-dependent oxidoreductase, partial [Ignavibacteriales bacterium]|nr:NAD(P)H-dependent oxidoreductase [Ignavibacteriales bacterium]
GFLILAAEYNHSIPPALKNLLDHFREEYFFKPSAIISYSSGPFAGVRAGEHLKLICSELKTPPIPSTLPISRVHNSILEDGTSVNGDYERRAKKFLDEFAWYLEAMKVQREKGTPY